MLPCNTPLLPQEEGGGTDLTTYNFGAKSGRVGNAISVDVTGGWVGHGAVLDWYGKCHPHRVSNS